eukprot:SAG31_NODE_10617_length_1117_cov_0.940079_2_plen_194_part_01
MVSPQELADGPCGTGWNTGDTIGTCTREAWSAYGANATGCYDSCRMLGACTDNGIGAQCRWSTCYDDRDFIVEMLGLIEAELCIDTAARFATGGSNGGMMIHYLTAELPAIFRAVAPIYGLPLRRQLRVPQQLATVSILQFHDRWDTTIPVAGGKSAQGWWYSSLEETLQAWVAAATGEVRNEPAVRLNTTIDG